jgi:hypothetical protein
VGTYIANANFYLDANRIATKGETIALSDREAIEPLRASRIEPADAETSARWRRVVPTNWQAVAAPESLTARDFAHAWRGR